MGTDTAVSSSLVTCLIIFGDKVVSYVFDSMLCLVLAGLT